MKRVIAFLLALMMLPIFSVVGSAADAMSKDAFIEVLTGISADDVTYDAHIIRAYKNVSKDQIAALKAVYDAVYGQPLSDVQTLPTLQTVTSPCDDITDEEAQILVRGIIGLMVFPNEKAGAGQPTSNNTIGTNDINRAADIFFEPFNPASPQPSNAPTSNINANIVLNKLTGGNMSQNALGALLYQMQKSLRRQAYADTTVMAAFVAAFATPDAGFVTAIKPYIAKALAEALTEAGTTVAGELNVAKTYLLGKSIGTDNMLKVNGTDIDASSEFIQFLMKAIDVLAADQPDALATVFNTIISGVIDAKVEVYSDAAGTQKVADIYPNGAVPQMNRGDVLYLKVVSDEAAKLAGEVSVNFASSLDAGIFDTTGTSYTGIALERDPTANLLKLTANAAGNGILKLYRDTNAAFAVQTTNDNVKELFMELDVSAKSGSPAPVGPSGGGGGGTKRVEAPTVSYEVDEDGKIIVTLETATNGATICYTTDGTVPSNKTTKYEGPFEVADGTTIKAIGTKAGYIDSYITTETINLGGGGVPALTEEHIAYVHGRDTGNFDAEHTVTRAEVAAIFSRLIVKKMVFSDDSANMFNDVSEDAWYASYVTFLSNVGIIKGYEDGSFKPDSPISRAEFATIASRFFELEENAPSAFEDVAETHWAKAYIDSAVAKAWLVGYEDGTFKPDQSIKRSETVTIVNRMLNRVADKAYIAENLDTIITYPDLEATYWAYYEILEASNWHDHKIENNEEIWTEVFVGE